MVSEVFFPSPDIRAAGRLVRKAFLLVVPWWALGGVTVWGETVSAKKENIIGATAMITEMSTGFSFPARIDTGAKSCSLHVEKIEVKDEDLEKPVRNVGKAIRFQIKNAAGETAWIETLIAKRVRIKSAANGGKYDGRYKVRLRLQWKNFKKEVLVTLNDRTKMAYPLLIGRNFLHDDFLVDVDINGVDQHGNPGPSNPE